VALDAAVVGMTIDGFRDAFWDNWAGCTPGPILRLGIRQGSKRLAWADDGTRSPAEVYELWRDRVVRIDVSCTYRRWWYACEDDVQFCGSGVIVANDEKHGLVVTNRHVVDPSFNHRHPLKKEAIGELAITVSNPSSKYRVTADVVALYRGDVEPPDLALVLIPLDGWTPGAVPIASMGSIRPGEDAVAIGCPKGLDFSISEGLIAQLRPEHNAVQTSCPISPGNSGGPLVLCDGGVLAGLNTSILVDERVQNINFAVRGDLIADPKGWEYQGKEEKTVRRLLGMIRVKGKERVKRCRRARGWGVHMEECAGGM
jgi:S1-C subfamily serine protease